MQITPKAAARLLGAADALRVRSGIAIPPFNLDEHQAVPAARTREVLSEAEFATLWIQEENLTLDQAVAEADAALAAIALGDSGAQEGTNEPAP